jgi:hypothetical protein
MSGTMKKNTKTNTKRRVGRPCHPVTLARLSVLIEAVTLARLHEAARVEERSLSAVVRRALAHALATQQEDAA